ncbi:MAG: YibE/F family protein [Thermoleophilia bacterium]
MALAAVTAFTALGLAGLWPDGRRIASDAADGVSGTLPATVTEVAPDGCIATMGAVPGTTGPCRRVTVRLDGGPDRGRESAFDLGGDFSIGPGDGVRVAPLGLPPGATVGGVPADPYAFSDFERRAPLLWLSIAFAALVLVSARWRGLRALLGLGASLAVVTLFVVPAILEGSSPVAVATFGSLAVMLVTIVLGHGIGPKAVAAILGTAAALLLTLLLATIAVDLTHITGLASEDATFLQATAGDISIRGLLLAGIVIAALGVLDDLTVTQASTVMALRAANPALGAMQLFRRGMSVGHDHIVATVNTLVLAYAGASLPVLLIFSLGDTSFSAAVNSEVVASQIVATLVGSMGLVAAVPITTGLAALLASRMAPDEVGDAAHGHAHP